MIVNYDSKTGIHYGVIPVNRVLQAWADESEPVFYPGRPSSYKENPIHRFEFKKEGYHLIQFADDACIFVCKSPFYTYTAPCSPCAPNAGDLSTYRPDGIKTFCLDSSWFEDEGEVPYPIFRVRKEGQING